MLMLTSEWPEGGYFMCILSKASVSSAEQLDLKRCVGEATGSMPEIYSSSARRASGSGSSIVMRPPVIGWVSERCAECSAKRPGNALSAAP